MSRLFVFRHGQACFHGDHYDQLSDLGQEQSQLLGEWLARQGLEWDHVFCGPKQRHRQTMAAVAAAYSRQGLSFPEADFLPDFDEHHGAGVVVQHLRARNQMPDTGTHEGFIQYFRLFEELSRRWVSGSLSAPEFETWQQFRDRVERGLGKLMASYKGNLALFTSGGPVALATGLCLGCKDVSIIELSWQVRNTGFSEFLFGGDRNSLIRFNATAHLHEPRLESLI